MIFQLLVWICIFKNYIYVGKAVTVNLMQVITKSFTFSFEFLVMVIFISSF